MSKTAQEAIEYLALKLHKATTIISERGKGCYEVDGKNYNSSELIKLANSTDPRTWFR
jgi:hypothetical protein